jgi:uncharacterized coiled-coil protein SlyX
MSLNKHGVVIQYQDAAGKLYQKLTARDIDFLKLSVYFKTTLLMTVSMKMDKIAQDFNINFNGHLDVTTDTNATDNIASYVVNVINVTSKTPTLIMQWNDTKLLNNYFTNSPVTTPNFREDFYMRFLILRVTNTYPTTWKQTIVSNIPVYEVQFETLYTTYQRAYGLDPELSPGDIPILQARMGLVEGSVSRIDQSLNTLETTVAALQTTVATFDSRIKDLNDRVTTLNSSVLELQSQMAGIIEWINVPKYNAKQSIGFEKFVPAPPPIIKKKFKKEKELLFDVTHNFRHKKSRVNKLFHEYTNTF